MVKRFRSDRRGAVTVMVTLLLIPAVLVSGTAVDYARIFSARSTLQDANQLAANGLLASYDAMLKDLYGLFGIMSEDEVLAAMINEYIEVAILGEDWMDRGVGTFQLTYAPKPNDAVVAFDPNMHLKNPEVLRRQIEEYAKFRAPVIIVNKVLKRLEDFKKVKADSEAIEKKIEIDDKIEEIDELYQRIYGLIIKINGHPDTERVIIRTVDNYLEDIKRQLMDLYKTRDEWTKLHNETKDLEEIPPEDTNKLNDHVIHYLAITKNINVLVSGGRVGSGWRPGSGWASRSSNKAGLEKTIDDGKEALKEYKDLLDDLLRTCRRADGKKRELSNMVDDLERKLADGSCSDEMVKGMIESDPAMGGKSMIDQYRDLLQFDLGTMASQYKEKGDDYINNVCATLDRVGFGKLDNENNLTGDSLSREELKKLENNTAFAIDFEVDASVPSTTKDMLRYYAEDVWNFEYRMGSHNGFGSFADCSPDHAKFFEMLDKMYATGKDGKSKKDGYKKTITKLLDEVQKLKKGFITEPIGAYVYKSGGGGGGVPFGDGGNWGDEDTAKKQTKEAMKGDLFKQLADVADTVTNKGLLVVYGTEMFSNYTTTVDPVAKTMAGIPLGVDVNYFFQSEQEYLIHGNLNSAQANHAAVGGLLFLVRFVFNYVASFTISDIKTVVNGIRTALGPFGFAVGELARIAFALAESALDVGRLRMGERVEVFKNNESWKFSVSGMIESGKDELADISGNLKNYDNAKANVEEGKGISYSEYLLVFLLTVDDNKIADRISNLISLNVTNKKQGIGAIDDRGGRETAMSNATLFDMSQAGTDFSIQTQIDLRMLFLSMPMAQKGINGVVPPETLPIVATDHRGY